MRKDRKGVNVWKILVRVEYIQNILYIILIHLSWESVTLVIIKKLSLQQI